MTRSRVKEKTTSTKDMIVIDIKETSLLRCVSDHCDKDVFEARALPVGDIIIRDVFIVERKTMADLDASLKDGRFREQRDRMLESGLRVVYIFEGIATDMMKKIAVRLFVRYGISSICTNDPADTVDVLYRMYHQSEKGHDILPSTVMTESMQKQFRLRKSGISKDVFVQYCLSGVPSVSREMAIAIQQKYKDLENIMDASVNDLSKVMYLLKSGKTRNVGNAAAQKIASFFTRSNPDDTNTESIDKVKS